MSTFVGILVNKDFSQQSLPQPQVKHEEPKQPQVNPEESKQNRTHHLERAIQEVKIRQSIESALNKYGPGVVAPQGPVTCTLQ